MNGAKDRLLELLTDRALVGLAPREQIELAELLVKEQDVDPGAFDRAASAVALAGIKQTEQMPAGLATIVEANALAAITSRARSASSASDEKARPPSDFKRTSVMPDDPPTLQAPAPLTSTMPLVGGEPIRASVPPVSSVPAPAVPPRPSYAQTLQHVVAAPSNVVAFTPAPRSPAAASRATKILAVSGWMAAAACLLLAIAAFTIRRPQPLAIVTPPPAPSPSVVEPPPPAPPETAADLRKKLLEAAGTLRAEWASTKDPAGKAASGEVVWNKQQQRGTMTFRGLGKNDPSQTQFQLWIFDKSRDEKYPVDGGVFDIDSETGDVVVPIKAAVPVATPTLFAVTIEKSGGVVVSKREHLVLTAKM